MSSKVKIAYHSSSSSEDEIESDMSSLDESGAESDDSGSVTSASEDETSTTTAKPKKHGAEAVVDVMAKILGKNLPDKKNSILCKGATDKQLQRKRKRKDAEPEDGVEVVKTETPDSEDSDLDDGNSSLTLEQKQKRRIWENMGRVKPNILDKDSEKQLQRIATKGVVQLFNAVKKQQKLVGDKLKEAGSSVNRRDKAMATITKGQFMDVLKGQASNVSSEPLSKKVKTEPMDIQIKEEKDDPSWSILRDDFMMGAKMKDWDKDSDGSDGERGAGISDSDGET